MISHLLLTPSLRDSHVIIASLTLFPNRISRPFHAILPFASFVPLAVISNKCRCCPLLHLPPFSPNISLKSPINSQFSLAQSNVQSIRPSITDTNKLHISPECLSMLYTKSLDEVGGAKLSRESEETHRRKRIQIDLQECSEWSNGKSELCKKLLLKQVLEKDVGLETVPPSFISSCLKYKIRREKIHAAKVCIVKMMHPLNSNLSASASPSHLDGTCREKKQKRRGMLLDGVGWEDLIIETLLLHQVKEEEIEKGHYNMLLDLHVFNSGVV